MILTKEEKAWVKKVNKALAECPSNRLRFFTIGDSTIYIADNDTADEWDVDNTDPLLEAQRHDAVADETIEFPNDVEGACG
jgi:predicted nucleotidyltransferase